MDNSGRHSNFLMRVKLCSLLCVLSIATLLASCAGGGSAGTGGGSGVERTFRGSVRSVGAPVANVRVSLVETGATSVTDAEGKFSLQANLPSDSATLGLIAAEGQAEQFVDVPIDNPDSTVISVDISLDAQKLVESVSRFYMWARVVGECARYFDNQEIIRQKRKTPPELPCTMRFFVNGGVTPLENIPGAMQVRSCDSTLWRPLATGATGRGAEAGVGEIDFTFIDNERNCEYRIVAPFDVPPLPELSVLLQTLTLTSSQAKK